MSTICIIVGRKTVTVPILKIHCLEWLYTGLGTGFVGISPAPPHRLRRPANPLPPAVVQAFAEAVDLDHTEGGDKGYRHLKTAFLTVCERRTGKVQLGGLGICSLGWRSDRKAKYFYSRPCVPRYL